MTTMHPPSPYALTIDPARVSIGDGDNWPMTWAADDRLYAFFTDGRGFDPDLPERLGSVLTVIDGVPPEITGTNLDSATGTVRAAGGEANAKACALIATDGALHCLMRNINPPGRPIGTGSSLMTSADAGQTWSHVDWRWPDIGYPVWINCGRDAADAPDDHLHFIAPDGPNAYADYPDLLLARVPRGRVCTQEAYEFFAGTDPDGTPRWATCERRRPCFRDPAGCFRPEMVYHAGLRRYLLAMASPRVDWHWWRIDNPHRVSRFALYESEQPWGPWRTIHHDPDWCADEDRFQPRLPAKWFGADDRSFHLAYSCIPRGPFALNVQACRLHLR